MRATYSDYVVKKALQTWLIMNVVFNMVEAWKPACGETSQYIKSHETFPTLQINYCIVEHVKKKKTTCAPVTGKATFIGQLPSWLTCVAIVTNKLLYLLTSLD